MNNEQLADEILEKIKSQHIKPTPKWEFEVRHVLIWLLLFISLIIGALATSVIIFMFENNQWDLADDVSDNLLGFILATLPYFWLIISVIFVYFVYINFKNTQRGYKYSALLIVGGGILTSVIFGFIFYNLGLGQTIDDIFESKAPFYNQIINRRPRLFYQPTQGILPGRIITIINPQQFMLDDFNRQEWLVLENASLQDLPLHEGQSVIVIGTKTDDLEFLANDIRILKPQIHMYFRMPLFGQRQ